MKNNYKVFIPTAGFGTRVGPFTKTRNKALLTVGSLPAIIHIIEQFDRNIDIVIALGYKALQVKSVISLFYPKRKITFVEIDDYKSPHSGLGYTLLKCKSHLQSPFIFCSNDTIFKKDISKLDPNLIGNWIAYYTKKPNDFLNINQYRTIEYNNNKLIKINPKGISSQDIYIGLCGIYDFKKFWRKQDKQVSNETGESFALNHLDDVKTIKFRSWWDTGNLSSLSNIKKVFASKYNILEKEDESIWFYKNFVLKFSTDKNFIKNRVQRSLKLNKLVPKIILSNNHCYKYRYINGKTISSINSIKVFKELLEFCKINLWKNLNNTILENTKCKLLDFYLNKTLLRLNKYHERFETYDKDLRINGLMCPKILSSLNDIDWDDFADKSILGQYHGDLHSENIIKTNDSFKLLDWRQDFNDINKSQGDIYYDFAKLLHGLLVSHKVVSKNQFNINYIDNSNVNIFIYQPKFNLDRIKYYKEWIILNGYCWERILFITSLIFLNIAALHEPPYSTFLYYFGKHFLNNISKFDNGKKN